MYTIGKLSIGGLLLALILGAGSGWAGSDASAQAPVVTVLPQPIADQFLALVNRERRAIGVAELLRSEDVQAVATERAIEMAVTDRAEHADAQGVSAADLLEQRGVIFHVFAENIGVYPGTVDVFAEALHLLWMASPDHRTNLLNPAYVRAGIGVAAAGGAFYVVEVFID